MGLHCAVDQGITRSHATPVLLVVSVTNYCQSEMKAFFKDGTDKVAQLSLEVP